MSLFVDDRARTCISNINTRQSCKLWGDSNTKLDHYREMFLHFELCSHSRDLALDPIMITRSRPLILDLPFV